MNLLTLNNPKVLKSTKFGYLTAILHLAPHRLSGHNVCPKASPECIALCLNTAGRGGMFKKGETTNRIQLCRIRRTKLFTYQYDEFMTRLIMDITRVIYQAELLGLKPAIRLNGTSDIPWENCKYHGKTIFEMFPDVIFYDYTKIPGRVVPSNYHLTFSLDEGNLGDALSEMDKGRNVAVVFHKVPATYAGFAVVDGDANDLRFLDLKNVIVGLKAKGRARKSTGGFVK